MLNHITIMGRFTRDPELRHTQSGTPVSAFTMAVDRDGRGDGEKKTDFIECVGWRATAEFIDRYFRKGSMAVVSGRLQVREWTDKDGNKRKTAEVIAESIYFGESKRREEGDAYRYEDQNNYGVRPFQEIGDEDGELPF